MHAFELTQALRLLHILRAVAARHLVFCSGDHDRGIGRKKHRGGRDVLRLQPSDPEGHGVSADVPGFLRGLCGLGSPIA